VKHSSSIALPNVANLSLMKQCVSDTTVSDGQKITSLPHN